MKRILLIILSAVMLSGVLTACSGSTQKIADIKDVDIDLTALSSTLVYSEVVNMIEKPEDYIGKKVKMKGALSTYEDMKDGTIYYACIVADATACCQQGIEFHLAKETKYPELGTEIEVVGDFDTYMDGKARYCCLENAVMEVV